MYNKRGNTILVAVSAILVFIAVLKINLILALFCFVPLFIVLQNSRKQYVKTGIVFGITLSLISFFWMIPGAQRFTGSSILYGLLVFSFSAVVLTLYWMLLFTVFDFLQKEEQRKADVIMNAALAGCIWVLGEALLALLSLRMPWFLFRTGIAVSGNVYAIQPVSLLGVSIATFVIVVVNYMIAYSLTAKNYKFLFLPVFLFAVYMMAGWGMYNNFAQQPTALQPIKAAVLTENVPAEMRWDESSGDALVQRLLGLAKAAVPLQPDIAVWTESTVPWTYRKDDDFVNEILYITKSGNITHILGINSNADSASVYNSVYSIQPDGRVTARYDKRYLLGFIEQRVAGIIFPFLSSGGYVVEPGTERQPLQTPYGKAGILICNESTISSAAADVVNNGAQFILNMSNDGWFADTYIAGQHFYNARLRAVETRKDVVVNSNDGITGLIKASGEIVHAQRSDEPSIDVATIQPNNFKSLATSSPYIMLYVSGIFVLLNAVIMLRVRVNK